MSEEITEAALAPAKEEKVVKGEVVQIHTAAPIAPAELKRNFTENIEFVLDYDKGRFKGQTLMIYLSNLDIKVRLQMNDHAASLELLAAYLKITTLVKIPEMEDLAINMLLAHLGRPNFLEFDPSAFLAEHAELLNMWERRLNSLTLFAMYSMNKDKYMSYIEQFPQDPDDGVAGINFVQLIKHDLFPLVIDNVPESKWTWNKKFFTEYMFAGSNLFKFFAVNSNPLFVGILAMTDPDAYQKIVPALTKAQESLEAVREQLQSRIDHVPPV